MSGLTPPSPRSHFTSEICPSLPTAGFKSVSLPRVQPSAGLHSESPGRELVSMGVSEIEQTKCLVP